MVVIYPVTEMLASIERALRDEGMPVLSAGQLPPEPPYVRLSHGGWQLRDGIGAPVVITEIIHAYDPAQGIPHQTMPIEGAVYAILRNLLIAAPSPPTQVEDVDVGDRTVKRLVSRMAWRMP